MGLVRGAPRWEGACSPLWLCERCMALPLQPHTDKQPDTDRGVSLPKEVWGGLHLLLLLAPPPPGYKPWSLTSIPSCCVLPPLPSFLLFLSLTQGFSKLLFTVL